MESFLPLQKLLFHLRLHPEDTRLVYSSLWGGFFAIVLVAAVLIFYFRKYCAFVSKMLLRNLLRTVLTSLSIMVLVFVVTLVWSFLAILDFVMTEQSKEQKAIVTEKWQVPSQMPFAYAATLERGAPSRPGDYTVSPENSMTWQFYGGTLDKDKKTFENIIFFFALEPRKLPTMMDELDTIDRGYVNKLTHTKQGAILGKDRMKKLNKRIGDHFTVTGLNYKDIDLEFEIVGVFPEGRYDQSAAMNRDYLNDALDAYKQRTGKAHPLADRSLGLVWLRLPDSDTFNQVAKQVTNSPNYTTPAVKCETIASGITTWLAPYQDLLNGLKWFLMPALLATMALVMSNAISISVRERRTEIAVLKVLGYGPGRILSFILGEALLIGGGSGLLSAGLSYLLVHVIMGGIKFPIAFFPLFDIYIDALWWGLLVGALTAFLGSIVPAWSAMRVRVSEVFAKVT